MATKGVVIMPFDREKLKGRRVDMGITLQEVADAIGVEKPTVQRYESGKINKIDTITVEKLASAIKCSPAYLMGWKSTPQIEPENNFNLNAHEKALITAYRGTPDMQAAVDRVLGISIEQEEFAADRTSYIKTHALPFAAAGGDSSNLGEAQELYDAKRKEKRDGK